MYFFFSLYQSSCSSPAGLLYHGEFSNACSSSQAACGYETAASPLIQGYAGLTFESNYAQLFCQNTAIPTVIPTLAPSVAPILYPSYVYTDRPTAPDCFSKYESIQLESGSTKFMQNVEVGDRVLVSSLDGQNKFFSEVIFLPHPRNSLSAEFVLIETASGRSLKVTPDHLVSAAVCEDASLKPQSASSRHPSLPLIPSKQVTRGMCVNTLNGQEVVISAFRVLDSGVYTAIVMDHALLVVNGIISSPYERTHMILDSFYDVYRALYKTVSFARKALRRSIGSCSVETSDTSKWYHAFVQETFGSLSSIFGNLF